MHKIVTTIAATLTLAATLVLPRAFAVEPANLSWGPVFVTPTLDTRLEYTDNVLRTPDDDKDSMISVIKPRVQAWMENGLNTYSLAYTMIDTRYFDSSRDDYTDNQLNLDIYHEFNARNRANLYAEYFDAHEERGTGLSEGVAELLDEPVEFERTTLGGDYTLGSAQSRGRLLLAGKTRDIEYQNFRETTRYRDYSNYGLGATFFWRIKGKTDLVAEVRYQETEYDKVDPTSREGTLDSEEYNYLVGLSWDATAKTSGSVKVGAYDRTYDSNERSDSNGFSWEADVSYQLRTYSIFTLASKRFSAETNGAGDAVNANRTTLGWSHNWNKRSSTNLTLGYLNEDYEGTEREDDEYQVSASYNYAMRRWLDLGAGYSYADRDSDIDLYEYSRSVVYITASVSL